MRVVVAERALEFNGDDRVGTGTVRVYAPFKDERVVDWCCQFQISWPGFEQVRSVFAPDSWGALFCVRVAAPKIIAKTEDFVAGRIGMFGEKLTTLEQIEAAFGMWRPNE